VSEAEERYRQLDIKCGENRIWKSDEEFERARVAYRTPSPEEERFPREASRKRGEDVLGTSWPRWWEKRGGRWEARLTLRERGGMACH